MPGRDGTGPTGQGPATGQGLGPCAGGQQQNSGLQGRPFGGFFGRGRGKSRGRGMWFWGNGYASQEKTEDSKNN